MPMRRADMSSAIGKQDKIQIKPHIFLSTFILFNASIATLYLALRGKEGMRSIGVPVGLGVFGLLAYKIELEWFSREIIRKCETSPTDSAYFMRRQLLVEFGEHPFVKIRRKMLEDKNK
jgi:hypothetical protein